MEGGSSTNVITRSHDRELTPKHKKSSDVTKSGEKLRGESTSASHSRSLSQEKVKRTSGRYKGKEGIEQNQKIRKRSRSRSQEKIRKRLFTKDKSKSKSPAKAQARSKKKSPAKLITDPSNYEFFEDVEDLPERVKAHLPTHAQHIFMKSFDNAIEHYQHPAKRRSESDNPRRVAYAVAWNAVKMKYHKDPDTGEWVENDPGYKEEEEDPEHTSIVRSADPEQAAQKYAEYLRKRREERSRTKSKDKLLKEKRGRSRSRSKEKDNNNRSRNTKSKSNNRKKTGAKNKSRNRIAGKAYWHKV